jgi:BirA family biotin operon repressor/biotin-[acetyl-CoA-carboxylase] ligase
MLRLLLYLCAVLSDSEFRVDLQRGAFDDIHTRYHAALYRSSGLHPFRDADGPFRASIEGVAPTGHLLLRDTDQRLRRYAFKEVSFC